MPHILSFVKMHLSSREGARKFPFFCAWLVNVIMNINCVYSIKRQCVALHCTDYWTKVANHDVNLKILPMRFAPVFFPRLQLRWGSNGSGNCHAFRTGTAFSTKRRFKQKYRSTWLSRSDILHGYRRKCWNLINLMNAQKRQHSQGLKACCLLVSANLTFCLELMSITAKRLCEQWAQ